MSQSLPADPSVENTEQKTTQELGRSGRILLTVLALGMICVLGIACYLKPSERGYGTHRQLGLPPCTFEALTGMRCPSCGMTTSFAHTVRGQFGEAVRANLAGMLLALTTVVSAPWCLLSAIAGRRLWIRRVDTIILAGLVTLISTSLVQWIITVFLIGEQG